MIFKRPKSAVSNQRGFTAIELLMVMAVLGMLSAIAVQQIKFNRENAYDRQAQSIVRNLLTYSAVDEPITHNPGGAIDDSGTGGNSYASYGYPEVNIPVGIYWRIINDDSSGDDKWMFFFAHPNGKIGYYFWIPGDKCNATDDGSGNRSDKLFSDNSAGSYRNTASDGALP
jgi:prepilin-type N-terminal cleavage/methylation domain-containing protein